jgi:alcohol dehydrogenase
MSTGFAGAERGDVRIVDTVAVFAQGPIGLCATAGARLAGATTVSRRMGADHVADFQAVNPVAEIMCLTDGRGRGRGPTARRALGVDVAIEALYQVPMTATH